MKPARRLAIRQRLHHPLGSDILGLAPRRRAGRDPTNTMRLRASARATGRLLLRRARAELRQHLVDRDALGLVSGPMTYHPEHTRVEAWHAYVSFLVRQLLVGPWLNAHLARAAAQGGNDASREVDSSVSPEATTVAARARLDLEGLAAAIIQQVARAGATASGRRMRLPAAWRCVAAAFDKVGEPRLCALVNTYVVKAYNQAKLQVYRAAGLTQVGVIPEMLPTGVTLDARRRYIEEPIEVGIRTAGDDRVCYECDEYAGGAPYDLDEVEDTLPLHPNCRCTWFPWEDRRFRDAVEIIRS